MSIIYRVENQITWQGLWYDKDGNFNPFIKKLSEAKSRDLPMGINLDVYRQDGKEWISAGDSIPQMKEWFYHRDVEELSKAGYHLYEFHVHEYRQVPGHVIFTRDAVIGSRIIDFDILK